MDVKKCITELTKGMGLTKKKVAELFGTNPKMVDAVLASDDGDYMVSKIVRPKAIALGTRKGDDETS